MTEKISEAVKEAQISQVVRGQVVGYLVASFGLVAGLAWNDAVKSLIEYFFPLSQNTIQAKFWYALALSVFVGVVSYVLVKWSGKTEK